MYCKDCKSNENSICTSEKIDEERGQSNRDDMLIYNYCEGGGFSVGDMFGCIHFEDKNKGDGPLIYKPSCPMFNKGVKDLKPKFD